MVAAIGAAAIGHVLDGALLIVICSVQTALAIHCIDLKSPPNLAYSAGPGLTSTRIWDARKISIEERAPFPRRAARLDGVAETGHISMAGPVVWC